LEDALEEVLKALFFLFGVESDVEVVKHLPYSVELSIHDVTDKHDDGLHDELDKATGELTAISIRGISSELLFGGIEVVVTPKLLHKFADVELELLSIDTSKSGKGESPAEESRTEGDCAVGWVNLLRLAHIVTFVG
jgi:hypothetical protein